MFKYKDYIFGSSLHIGLILFFGLVIAVLTQIPFAPPLILHPLFMTLFIILITEGVALLQPTSTEKEKKKGLKLHALVQGFAYVFLIVGFGIMVNSKMQRGGPHFASDHAKFGLTVFIYIFFQALFGITTAYFPGIFGSVTKGKSLWKFHRMTGYLFLVIVWVTAQLGIRTDLMKNFMPVPNLMAGHWVALVLVVIGIAGRVRIYKWGLVPNPHQHASQQDSSAILQYHEQQTVNTNETK
ncbi:eukaryotic cytochrome b561-domain-containing protein [Phascolomyces articulosus]|uniref:Eukaryotic cytochrome b561-domain-containing protein n=1 Tax=Phascolomyces articulosus TaxID=60185 RepID=A0AAD5K0L8_9FUNG|nr:eukaryotic cytochrome b561-domain-containing protein [Phascolomyces articulosus]